MDTCPFLPTVHTCRGVDCQLWAKDRMESAHFVVNTTSPSHGEPVTVVTALACIDVLIYGNTIAIATLHFTPTATVKKENRKSSVAVWEIARKKEGTQVVA
jgi:hypothetical protein